MKKILFISLLLFFILTNQLIAGYTASITINGRVLPGCIIEIIPTGNQMNLNNIADGANDLHIADIVEKCNDNDGYTVTLKGLNSTAVSPTAHTGLFEDSISGDQHEFAIKYNETEINNQLVTDSLSQTPTEGITKTLKIDIPQDYGLTPSVGYTYYETLLLDLTVK